MKDFLHAGPPFAGSARFQNLILVYKEVLPQKRKIDYLANCTKIRQVALKEWFIRKNRKAACAAFRIASL